MRKFLKALAIIAVIALAAVYWLFYDNRPPTSGSFPLDIAALRAAANQVPGSKPLHIEMETVSHTKVPKIAMVAGTSWDKLDEVRNSYRLVWADHAIILDTGYDAAGARATKADSFDPTAWAHIVAGLKDATQIIVTHEHGDHIGGNYCRRR
jgi:hypothetical protein